MIFFVNTRKQDDKIYYVIFKKILQKDKEYEYTVFTYFVTFRFIQNINLLILGNFNYTLKNQFLHQQMMKSDRLFDDWNLYIVLLFQKAMGMLWR